MCGYYYSHNLPIDSQSLTNLVRRGPESFSALTLAHEQFGHALLNTRGESTQQPIQNNHGTLVYNGSTYNSVDNDTQWIIRNLDEKLETTVDLIKSLIGEYSLTYVTESHIVFAVDQWSTKNLFFYYNKADRTFIIASSIDVVLYHAPNAVRVEGNRIYIIDKSSFDLDIVTTTQWNFDQTVNNYDAVFETFEQAIIDRHEPNITTYLLSAGIDAGSMACCAKKFFGNSVQTVSKIGKEDAEILNKRMQLHEKSLIDPADDSAFQGTVDDMFAVYGFNYMHSPTARATSAILQNYFLPLKQKILISGIGGDELYADYMTDKASYGRVGKVNGAWPSDLKTIYPWHNYEGTRMHFQLHRSDMTCGYHGIEARYPLADQRLFQRWLNTTVNLKNSGYKHWQTQYMLEHDYPVTLIKSGFTSNFREPHFMR